ncbi:YheU family protein [Oligoflexia bacterium]|nr:YheU family protein [Oligoflexia bacterium]
MEIPYHELKPETLRSVIEEFVLREGTDYGRSEYSLDQKVDHVRGQLERGQVVVVYDTELETCNIVVKS